MCLFGKNRGACRHQRVLNEENNVGAFYDQKMLFRFFSFTVLTFVSVFISLIIRGFLKKCFYNLDNHIYNLTFLRIWSKKYLIISSPTSLVRSSGEYMCSIVAKQKLKYVHCSHKNVKNSGLCTLVVLLFFLVTLKTTNSSSCLGTCSNFY